MTSSSPTSRWWLENGYVHKLCALFHIEVAALEAMRWEAVYHHHHPHPNEHTCRRRTRSLVVAFAGGAVQIGGVIKAEFKRTVSELGVDAVFLTDPDQLWYTRKLVWLKERLRDECQHYERVVFVGSCMGASAALLFSELASVVLAFIPQTNLVDTPFFWYWLGGLRLPSSWRRAFTQRMQHAVLTTNAHVHTYFPADDSRWQQQIEYLPVDAPNLHVHGVHSVLHKTQPVRHFRERGELIPLIRQHILA